MTKKLFTTSAIATTFFMSAANANAATEEETIKLLQEQLNQMQKQITDLQSQVKQQAKVQAETAAKAANNIEPAAGKAKGGDDFKITFKPTPKIESVDGTFSFQPFGRVHLDTVVFSDDIKEHGDNANFRRARMGFKGKVAEDFKYKFEMDFARELANFKEVSLTYTGFEDADIKVGHFKPFFGLEENQSSNYIQFMERAPAGRAFTRDEEIGIGVITGGDDWSFSIGAFNEDGGTETSATNDEARTGDARLTFAPLNEKSEVVHLGVAGSHRVPNATANAMTFSSRVTGVGSNLVSTGAISDVDSVSLLGLEAATALGSFAAQAEYFHTYVDRKGAPNPEFDGWYAQASYFLTGESRPYSGKAGNFKRVKPIEPFSLSNGGTGAWEVLARYSDVDLNDAGAGILGGRQQDVTVGLNWYINNHTRLMGNYVWTDVDGNGVVPFDSPEAYMLRAAWDF